MSRRDQSAGADMRRAPQSLRRKHARLGVALALSTLIHAVAFYIGVTSMDRVLQPLDQNPDPLQVSIQNPGTAEDQRAPSDGLDTPEIPLPVADTEPEATAPEPEPLPEVNKALAGTSTAPAAETSESSGTPTPEQFDASTELAAIAAESAQGHSAMTPAIEIIAEVPRPTPVVETLSAPSQVADEGVSRRTQPPCDLCYR